MTVKITISVNSNQEPFIPSVLSTPLSKKLILGRCAFRVAVHAGAEAANARSASAAWEASSGTRREEQAASEGSGTQLS